MLFSIFQMLSHCFFNLLRTYLSCLIFLENLFVYKKTLWKHLKRLDQKNSQDFLRVLYVICIMI